jgi:hypothetical protein
MRFVPRHPFVAISLALVSLPCIASAWFWVESYQSPISFTVRGPRGPWQCTWDEGRFRMRNPMERPPRNLAEAVSAALRVRVAPNSLLVQPVVKRPLLITVERSDWRVPAWVLVAVLAIPNYLWIGTRLAKARRRRGRAASGRCVACGYDLRATPGRCPECGIVVGELGA